MPRQSQLSAPTCLLTRPAAQNMRFAAQLRARFGSGLRIVESPLLAPRFLRAPVPDQVLRGVVFTSESGVEGFRRLGVEVGGPAWCVGSRTAAAAAAAGFHAVDGGGDARRMTDRIIAARPSGHILVVRGRDQAFDVASGLNSAGLESSEAIVYVQDLQPMAEAAETLLAGDGTVVVPLFSARTAAHFAVLPAVTARCCPLWIAALSAAVSRAAEPARPERAVVAARPEAAALIDALEVWYGTARQP
jgi:uroporphyrinogen-III synthase